jgi:SMI1 / KNR4 family (SUKH-1)
MTLDDFLLLVDAEHPIIMELPVSVPGPAARELLASGRAVPLSEYLGHPNRHHEMRTFRFGHLLGPGLHPNDIDEWQARFPAHRLPADLRQFLSRVNGVELWADLDDRKAYMGILPLAQWTDVTTAPFAYIFDAPPKAALVLSHAQDTAGFAVLDTDGPIYLWCDPIGGPEVIGTAVTDLLEYWWKHCRIHPSVPSAP